MGVDNLIKLKNLCHNYRQGYENIEILKDVTIQFKSEQVVGLIGPSGSGKSTLLNILGLIQKPERGNVEICGTHTNFLNESEKTKIRREKIGYVFQDSQLLEDFNCLENIAIPLILNGISKTESFDRAEKIMQDFGLKKKIDYKPSLLSGGENQRVSVLRALIKKPQILLADEPTGSLDKKNASLVSKYIFDVSRQFKTLCIVATHNLDFVPHFDVCYRISNYKLRKI